MSEFDGIFKAVFSTVQQIFGDTAIWLPFNGSAQRTAKVLFNNPDSKEQLGDVEKYDYQPYNNWFEYFEEQLPELKLSVDSGNDEIIEINGNIYIIRLVITKFDGKNCVAFCDIRDEQSRVITG
jgi:hypothetical protein